MKKNLYQLLGVSEEASVEEIDARYKALREKYENIPGEEAANELVLVHGAKLSFMNKMYNTNFI